MDTRPGGSAGPSRLTGIVLIALVFPISGCDLLMKGLEAYTDCDRFDEDYADRLATEGELSDTVPSDTDQYPMSIIISQDALNRLFEAVSEGDLAPLTATYDVLGIPVTVGIDPELPLLQVGGERGCGDCILLEMGFSVWVEMFGLQYGGSGSGRYQFPLEIVDNGMESSSVFARLAESEVLEVDISLTGIDDAYLDLIEGYVADLATLVIQQSYGDVRIFDLEAWKLGDGAIRLLGRGPHIYPDQGTVVIGLQTNLVRPLNGAVTIDPVLPDGADLGMQFHPELIQQIIARMLHEGYIPRTYSSTGQAEDGGAFSVTMNRMETADEGLLGANFRLWQTGGDYCGWADIGLGLGLSITGGQVRLSPVQVEVTDADGVGQVLAMANSWLQSRFTQDMSAFSEIAINYRELTLPMGKQAEMSSSSFRLDLNANGLNVFLNLDAVVDAATD